jgi:EAL domain-containing protein (putative c-di-GMP-specific phosphodiesterase class I)
MRAQSASVAQAVERIVRAFEQPFVVQGLPLNVEASIGIALYPEHGEDVDLLLQRADVAMYMAKDSGSVYAVYDAERDDYNPTRLTLVGELRRAMEDRELFLHYQPKAALRTGKVTSVEALLRWQHPERGPVPPDEFVPLAQQTGLIKPLTLYVLEEALHQCREWKRQGRELAVAVNVSMRNLLDVEFPNDVATLLRKWDVQPSRLQLEITESAIVEDPFRTKAVLEKLSAIGVRLSIDDFGTGYSSLAYLKRLPVDEIKIDRSFVVNMEKDADDAAIVRSIIDLGRSLGLEVVAEGVETEGAWTTLDLHGCDLAQGYFLSPPLPAEELVRWLDQRQVSRAGPRRARGSQRRSASGP